MRICAHQPVYLPSIHLLNKISLTDGVVLLNHCQFVKRSWHIRNQVRSGTDKIFLTVPVQNSHKYGQSLEDTLIFDDRWKPKHLKTLQVNYSKRPYFKDYYPEIERLINLPNKNLITLNNMLLCQIMSWLDLSPKIFHSEEYNIQTQKSAMLIDLCKAARADQYVSNEGSRTYIDEAAFKENNIQHFWQEFTHPIYDQGRDFIPNLSVIDLLFNMGPASGGLVKNAGHLVAS
ncbi:MAG: WbqC family protein [Emcibacter sp.]|nr:WbqC family protein [Emcibacter sp.]